VATYVALINWTDQGIKNVKDTVTRVQEATSAFQQAGGKVNAVYWTQGSYDVVAIFDFADEVAFTAAIIGLARGGNVRTQTMRAFSADEMAKIIAKIP